jgi:hypothetical protein
MMDDDKPLNLRDYLHLPDPMLVHLVFSLWVPGAAKLLDKTHGPTTEELTNGIIALPASADTDSIRSAAPAMVLRAVCRAVDLNAEWHRAAKLIREHIEGYARIIRTAREAATGSRRQQAAAKAPRADKLTSAISKMLETDPAMKEREVRRALRRLPEFNVTEDKITYIPRPGAATISVKKDALKDRIYKARRQNSL